MRLFIVEKELELQIFIRDVFIEHQSHCFRYPTELEAYLRGLQKIPDVQFLIIDTDFVADKSLLNLQVLRRKNEGLKIIGMSIDDKPELVESKLIDALLVKPNILPLLDLAEGKGMLSSH